MKRRCRRDRLRLPAREKKATPNRPLAEALEVVLDEDDDDLPCLVYHL